jgi:hypothetical protein
MDEESQAKEKDKHLWRIAKKRVAFRRSLYLYIPVNAFLWLIWLLTNIHRSKPEGWDFPWPLYPMIGWGIGLVIQYFGVYSASTKDAVAAEYEKLKQQKK